MTDVDEKILSKVDQVDWDRVTEPEAASFGLAIGFFRDSMHVWQQHHTALGAAIGNVITMSMVALACLVVGTGPAFALGLIIMHQTVRAVVLWWKTRQAQKFVLETEKQAIDSADHLSMLYPVASARAA